VTLLPHCLWVICATVVAATFKVMTGLGYGDWIALAVAVIGYVLLILFGSCLLWLESLLEFRSSASTLTFREVLAEMAAYPAIHFPVSLVLIVVMGVTGRFLGNRGYSFTASLTVSSGAAIALIVALFTGVYLLGVPLGFREARRAQPTESTDASGSPPSDGRAKQGDRREL